MRNIAIDVALLPPPEIEQLAMDLNASLIEGVDDPPIRLDKNPCLPHATVVMAGVEEGSVDAIAERLKVVVSELMPFRAEISQTYGEENDFCGLELVKSPEILEFHKRVAAIVQPLAQSGITNEMFITEELDGFMVPYMENFFQESSFENYYPHITVGHGQLGSVDPHTFVFDRVAICHLGMWGTCQKILGEIPAPNSFIKGAQ